MPFSPQTFSFEEVLSSTKLNQTDTNIDEVRRFHKNASAPPSLVTGIMWIDDSSSPWQLKVYDGTDHIVIGLIDPTDNYFTPAAFDSLKIFDVKRYGATGDGATDDTTALQAAIDAAEAAGGGLVWLPPGDYVHSGLTIDSSGVILSGVGTKKLSTAGAVRLLYNSTTGDHLHVADASEVYIRNLTFDLEGAVGTPTAGNVIFLEQTTSGIQDNVVQDVRIAGGFNGIDIEGINRPVLERIHIVDIVGNYGIRISASNAGGTRVDLVTLRDIFFNSNVAGGSTVTDGLVLGEEVHSVFCENAHFQKPLVGVRLRDDGAGFSSAPQFCKFVDTEVENANSDGWRFQEARHVELTSCFAGSNGANGFHLAASINDYGFTMTGCLGVNNEQNGLFIEGNGHYCIVQGSRFVGNDNSAGDFDGIRVAAGVGSFQLIGNRCGGGNSGDPISTPQANGIAVLTGSSDNYIITLNDVRGNATSGVADGGTGTAKLVANNIGQDLT